MGLEWSDIDFEKNTISVNRTSLYTVSKGTFTDTTKNDYSLRTIYGFKRSISYAIRKNCVLRPELIKLMRFFENNNYER